MVRQAGADLGQSIGWKSTGGVCDGNNIAACGVPVIDTMGARGGSIHSMEEFLIVESLAERAALVGADDVAAGDGARAMSFRIRAATPDDLGALYELSKLTGGGFTNLPADKATLELKLAKSQDGFDREGENQDDDLFLFVLENVETKAIRGTCQVFGKVGNDRPFYSYRLSTLTQKSEELDRIFRNQTLSLCTDLEGSSEVGGLFLHPHERAGGLGMLLARSRYLFIKQHRPRFGAARAGRASRGDGPGRPFALLGRARRALLRHELSRSRRIQRGPRHPIHRRSDAQDADLCRDAARQREIGDGPAAPDRARGAADARDRRLQLRMLYRHFRRRADGHRGDRPDQDDREQPSGCASPGRRRRARSWRR